MPEDVDLQKRDNPIHEETIDETLDRHSSEERKKIIYRTEANVLNAGATAFDDAREMEEKLIKYYQQAGRKIKSELIELYERVDDWSNAELHKYNRLKKLMKQIKYELNLMGQKEKNLVKKGLEGVYKDQYIRNVYALGKSVNVTANLSSLNPKMVEKALNYPWSGAMFSDRIWDNKNKLVKNVREGIVQSAIHGEGMDKIAKRINKSIENSYYNALRVARTETMRVSYSAQMKAFEDNKSVIKKVEYSAFFDKRTCNECKKYDERVYKVGEERMLPTHPHCRCTYLPVIDEIQEGDLSEYAEKARDKEYSEFKDDVMEKAKAQARKGG